MAKSQIFPFLKALDANNSKAWMDANRSWYEEAKSEIVTIIEPILEELKTLDPRITTPTARKAFNRINNNLMFHPERPTYKDHFGVGFVYQKGLADFYIHFGIRETFVAGGLWHPDTERLKKVRQEIDYEGDKLREIIENKPFAGSFELYTEDALKTTPKGYPRDHEFADLLRLKSFAAMRPITRKDILGAHFPELVVDSYKAILPLLDFVNTPLRD